MKKTFLPLKKAVLSTLLALLCMAGVTNAFAQQRIKKSDIRSFRVDSKKGIALGNEVFTPSASNFAPRTAKSAVVNRYDDVEDVETMWTTYDLQSNGWCSNRMYQLPNGSAAVAATMSHEPNQSFADRGTGYNFYNAETGEWLEQPEVRVEQMRTGWPTIAQWGDNGEILISHSPLRCWTREVAGQGEWEYRGELPMHPEEYPYDYEDASWPRVATSGDHHNIIHVIADIQHSSNVVENHQVYYRSTDAENWTCTYSPLVQDGEETGHYSADNYNITANGHNVAIIYGDDPKSHVVMYKSTDDGQTWSRTVIWQNPYYGYDWETDPNSIYTDTVYGPANLAIAIDNNGIAHVAMSTYEYMHSELGSTYTYWSGRLVDGIYYWNDTQVAPIQSEDGNPHHALRLWWPDPENPGYETMHNDPTKWIGFVPTYDDYSFDNDKFFHENDYFNKSRSGLSTFPALSIDPMGNIACAFSAPNVTREDPNTGFYMRSIYVSYRDVASGYWDQAFDDITDPEHNFMFLYSENLFTNSVDNTTIPGEFWFSFQSDDQIGCWMGSNAYQNSASENYIHAVKVVHNSDVTSYRINVTANPSNGGTVTGAGLYELGDTCTLLAAPNAKFEFLNWTENGEVISTDETYSFAVTGYRNLVANFLQVRFDITASANPEEGGTIEGTGIFMEGQTCTLTATPNEDYHFVNWTENGEEVSTNAEYAFVVAGERHLVANFALPTYTINAIANPTEGGTISILGSTTDFDDGTLQGWTAVDADGDGYHWEKSMNLGFEVYGHNGSNGFVLSRSWYDGILYPDNYLISPHTALGGSITFYACAQDNAYAAEHFGVAVSTVSTNPSDFTTIQEWTMTAKGGGTPTSTTRSGNRTQGTWYEYTVDLSAYAGQSGYVAIRHFNCYDMFWLNIDDITISQGEAVYEHGSTCTMTAIPNYGYAFENWTEGDDVISTNAELSFTVTNDRNLVANFVLTPFTINATPNFDDRGTVSGAGEFVINQTCTLTATPNEGHNFVHWMENGEVVSTEASYSFTVDGPRDLVAVFTAHVDDIIVFADPNVEAICVSYWDTDGDGFLSYNEAAAVTDLGQAFYYNSEINSFEELQYFTGLTFIADWAFNRCYGLTSIVFPESINSIGMYAFYYCSNLTSINIPNTVTAIGVCAFQNCNSLTSLDLPASVTTIGYEAFRNCSGLRGELTLPESLEFVDGHAFYGCDGISTVNYNATNCQAMGNVEDPVFYDCVSIEHINIGANVQNIPNFAFKHCFTVKDMTVAAINPPIVGSNTFTAISRSIPVSVPYGSGDAYRSAQYWEEFFNINEDYSPNPFTYHWNVNTHQFAGNMTVTGIIQIEGVEQAVPHLEIGAFCNGECRGRQLLTYYPQVDRYLVFLMLYGQDGDVFNFRLFDHSAGQELTAGCTSVISFETDATLGSFSNPYVFNFSNVQVSEFTEGWSWWSTYIEQDGIDGLTLLENGLGTNGLVIKSQSDGYTEYYDDYDLWYGSLNAINNESSYMVKTSVPCTVTMPGTTALPSQHPITVDANGWTWIGYPVAYDMDINAALDGLASLEGDVLKSQEGYAEFYEGYGWFGSLASFLPGRGYMYKSTSASPATFTYPSGSRGDAANANLSAKDNHWVPVASAYPFNMTITAVVELDGEELRSDRYELAAFANGESRGSVRLMYVEPIDRYVAFLTIAGEEAADLSLSLYDTETGMEYFGANETLGFEANATLGRLAEPFVVSFRGTTGMDELANSLRVYPNPVNAGERFSIGLNAESKAPVRVEIVNALGVIVSVETSMQAPASIKAPEAAGVYMMRVVVDGKGMCCRKLVVK